MCMRHGRALLLPILLPRFDNSTSSDSKTGFCGDCGGLTTIYATISATIWSLFGLLRVEKLAVSNRESMRVVSVFLFHFFPCGLFLVSPLFLLFFLRPDYGCTSGQTSVFTCEPIEECWRSGVKLWGAAAEELDAWDKPTIGPSQSADIAGGDVRTVQNRRSDV